MQARQDVADLYLGVQAHLDIRTRHHQVLGLPYLDVHVVLPAPQFRKAEISKRLWEA